MVEYVISMLVVFCVVLLLLFSGYRGTSWGASPGKSARLVSRCVSQTPAKESPLTRETLKNRLKTLSESPAPTATSHGAMCYAPVVRAGSADYFCPACGSKTLYSISTESTIEPEFIDDIPKCRRWVKELKALDAKLDESEFCKKCRPRVKNPSLWLIIRYPEQTKVHRVKITGSEDLQLISEFVSGKDMHDGPRDSKVPLKNYLPRLSELLGIPLK